VRSGRDFATVTGRDVERCSVREFDDEGQALAHVPFAGHQVGERKFWVLGTNRNSSWGSRYFGPTRAEDGLGSLRPVLTVGGP